MSTPHLKVSARRVERTAIVAASGEIDVATAPMLRSELAHQAGDADVDALVLDLCDVGFMDSSGLGVVIATLNRTTELGTRFSVVCPGHKLKRIFEITGVSSRLEMQDSLDDALASTGRPR